MCRGAQGELFHADEDIVCQLTRDQIADALEWIKTEFGIPNPTRSMICNQVWKDPRR